VWVGGSLQQKYTHKKYFSPRSRTNTTISSNASFNKSYSTSNTSSKFTIHKKYISPWNRTNTNTSNSTSNYVFNKSYNSNSNNPISIIRYSI